MARHAPPAALLVALVIAGGVAFRAIATSPEPAVPSPLPRGFASSAFHLVDMPIGGIEDLLEADQVIYQEARDAAGSEAGTLFIAYFRNRKSLAEPHEPEVCYQASGWRLRPADARARRVGRALVAEKGSERRLVFFWYETRAGLFSDSWPLKIDLVRSAMSRRPTDAALVRLTAPLGAHADEEGALLQLESFAGTLDPPVRPLFSR